MAQSDEKRHKQASYFVVQRQIGSHKAYEEFAKDTIPAIRFWSKIFPQYGRLI